MKLPFALARRFVAGRTLEESRLAVDALRSKELYVTLDLLGEYIKDKAVAEAAHLSYMDLIRHIPSMREKSEEAGISIKLSMLGQKIDEDYCLENVRRLLTLAKEQDVFVRLDMEGSDVTASTLAIFEKVYPDFPDHVGIVLQAYLKRTAGDIERMCELNARVRICKGAYKEPAALAYQDMPTIRKHYMVHARKLIQHARYPGIATHDDQLINEVKAFVAQQDVSKSQFEFQMLYGIRPETQHALRQEGYHMRVYIPYGTEWLPYFSRRLRERKENVWFVLKNLFRS